MAKAYEELELKDDFMFSVIMRDPKYVKPFLETILRIKIAKIEYPEVQKNIDIAAGAKGIRLDVYVEDENRCSEDTALTLNDGTVKIILNTKGTLDDVSPEMKRLLDYVRRKRRIGYLHKRFGRGGTVRPSKREMEVGLYDITAGI